jgi:hypothetical protein
METLHKDLPTSYQLSPTARHILLEGHQLMNMSRTAIVEQAVLEWGITHLCPELRQLHALFASRPAVSGGARRAT